MFHRVSTVYNVDKYLLGELEACKGGQVENKGVIESGVQLLTAQKPIKRPDWLKRKFALFWMPATSGYSREDPCPKAYSTP